MELQASWEDALVLREDAMVLMKVFFTTISVGSDWPRCD